MILKEMSPYGSEEQLSISDLNLHYLNQNLKDEKLLSDYGINGLLSSASTQAHSNNSRRRRAHNMSNSDPGTYELILVIGQKNELGKLALGLDFTFHTIKDVKKLEWSK
mmetsp:Transcript_12643/g.11194  ORF Transcript_12643/g.11194 Transcript_12643/m.11194 type:complete len:109 (+) Transcript_12643:400-726(+)